MLQSIEELVEEIVDDNMSAMLYHERYRKIIAQGLAAEVYKIVSETLKIAQEDYDPLGDYTEPIYYERS